MRLQGSGRICLLCLPGMKKGEGLLVLLRKKNALFDSKDLTDSFHTQSEAIGDPLMYNIGIDFRPSCQSVRAFLQCINSTGSMAIYLKAAL